MDDFDNITCEEFYGDFDENDFVAEEYCDADGRILLTVPRRYEEQSLFSIEDDIPF